MDNEADTPNIVPAPAEDPLVNDVAEGTATEAHLTDCYCWNHNTKINEQTRSLDDILAPIRKKIEAIFPSVQRRIASLLEDPPHPTDPQDYALAKNNEIFSIYTLLTVAMKDSAERIYQTSGYVIANGNCKHTYDQHLQLLDQRDLTLKHVEQSIQQTLNDAETLFSLSDKLVTAQRQTRRRKMAHMIVRTAAIISLPFAPLFSAVLTAADVMGFSIVIGVQECMASEAELASTTDSVEHLRVDMGEKIAIVQRLRGQLRDLKARALAQRDDPVVPKLCTVATKFQAASDLVDEVFGPWNVTTPDNTPKRSICELLEAIHRLMEELDIPIPADSPLKTLSPEAWQKLDGHFAAWRATPTSERPGTRV
ncbi:hypothetical protein GY45DRAFT_1375329 [Cubamyces sp. BRFM 1775]|nr:hypothetical protein GY45DRAFT_1375329 [Cubamyces sp. BRFM 1775]